MVMLRVQVGHSVMISMMLHVASVTDSVESVGGIETLTGSPSSPLLPHAPDPEVDLAPMSHCFAMLDLDHCIHTMFVLNPEFLAQKAVVEVPEGEPREHTTMRTGGN